MLCLKTNLSRLILMTTSLMALLAFMHENMALVIIGLCLMASAYSLARNKVSVIPLIISIEQYISNFTVYSVIDLAIEDNKFIVETVFLSLAYFTVILALYAARKSYLLVSVYCLWFLYSMTFELDYYLFHGKYLYDSYEYAIGLVNILIIAGLFAEAAKGGGKRALLDSNSNLPAYGFSSMADSSLHYPAGMGRHKRTI